MPEDPRLRLMRRLVTFLLMVLIAGTLAVVVALLIKLKSTTFEPSMREGAAYGLAPSETLISAEATAERITLLIEDQNDGARRVVILDAADFSIVGAVDPEASPEQ